MRLCLLLIFVMCGAFNSHAYCQDGTAEPLAQQIEVLELKLQLAEAQLETLQAECEALRKENAAFKKEEMRKEVAVEDQFAPGVVWVATSKSTGGKKNIPWAISISKRDGDKFEGGVATQSPNGEKFEFPVTGRAPRTGDGLVVLESPMIGRAKMFMRGTLRNGSIAIAFSATSPLGEKRFGADDDGIALSTGIGSRSEPTSERSTKSAIRS